MFRAKWFVLWTLWAARLVRQPTAPVRVSSGLLRGSIAHDGTYAQYVGIPYATIGDWNRFKAPGPEPKWEGIYEAINDNIRCQQAAYLEAPFTIGQENCLILNVYTPINVNTNKLLPVMAFIHGGGFFEGSSTQILYGPKYFVDKGVILVTFNYRVNIQGFLCLRTKDAPGNAGLKDQVAALKWIQRNIRAFGGDPDNVTLFGESAGSSSTSYHILSPMSKGLFQRAILQSGSSLAAWANQFRPIYMASLLAKRMGYNTEDPNELYKIFTSKSDFELIVTRVPRKIGNQVISEILYMPCVEEVIDGVEPFLTELPHNLLSRGNYTKVPVIIGMNNEEGFLFMGFENKTTISQMTFERSLAYDLVFPTEKVKNDVAEKLTKMYMDGDIISKDSLIKLSRFTGHMYLMYPLLEEIELMINTSDKPIYTYLFSYGGWRNLAKFASGFPMASAPGASHADDLFYMFSQPILPSLFESSIIHKVTTLWTNFAKYGNPTPAEVDSLSVTWPVLNTTSRLSLNIDKEFSIIPFSYDDRFKYWRELYSKYRRKK